MLRLRFTPSLLSRTTLSSPNAISSFSFCVSLRAASTGKAQWGDWSTPDSNDKSGDDENVRRTNYYDARQFMARSRGATVICRQKPVVKSYSERLWDYMKPRTDLDDSWIDSLQLSKIVMYLLIPILMMIWWKGHYEQYPDYWEKQASQLQSKPLSEQGGKQKYTYHDVIYSLEDKRDKAMRRKGYEADDGMADHMAKKEAQEN